MNWIFPILSLEIWVCFDIQVFCFLSQSYPKVGISKLFLKVGTKNSGSSSNEKKDLGKSNKIKIFKSKNVKGRNPSGRFRHEEDLEELFSRDNDEFKILKEKIASRRYFSEINNPLLKKISHSNQENSSLKIKKLVKRSEKRDLKYVESVPKVLNDKDKKKDELKKESDLRKRKLKKDKELTNDDQKTKVYRRTKLGQKELQMLPLKVPGIRSLDTEISDKISVEEVDSLLKLGYNGVIDMNSLFLDKLELSGAKSDSEFVKVSFDSLGIYDKALLETLEIKGIFEPTYTQSKFLPQLTKMLQFSVNPNFGNTKTAIINACTGSGKTLTYMLPVFQSCFKQNVPLFSSEFGYEFEKIFRYLRKLMDQDILVICPSLELCVQSLKVAKEILDQYKYLNDNEMECFYEDSTDNINKMSNSDSIDNLKVITEIRPTLLIGNANVIYQKKNIKKVMESKFKDFEISRKIIEGLRPLRSGSNGPQVTQTQIKRTMAMYFATPGRLHSILYKHKLLNLENFRYFIMDEYDSYLESKIKDPDKKIKNIQTKELINNIFNQMSSHDPLENQDNNMGNIKGYFDHLGRKYVICVSASDNIDLMPESFKAQFSKEMKKRKVGELNNLKSQDFYESDARSIGKSKNTYQFPKNILHTMAVYSVPDAKLSMLRKIMKSVPFEKSVLIFCDSNGTANFLYKYLGSIFKDSSIQLLNSVQNRLSRRKAFSEVIQTNIDNTNLSGYRRKSTRLVKDILISTRLNSRGIDFSGYTHVINYDLPHDRDSYIHKSGRIGRAGNPGICINLVESKSVPVFKRVIVNHLPLKFHTIDSNNGLLVTKPD